MPWVRDARRDQHDGFASPLAAGGPGASQAALAHSTTPGGDHRQDQQERGASARHQTLARISAALVPPKPKQLDMAT